MKDLVEGPRLAIKLGYINEDGSPGPRWGIAPARDPQQDLRAIAAVMPEIIVGQATPPERRAEYQAAGFTLVEMDEPRAAEIRTDPVTGRREYIAAYQPHVYAAASSTSSSPPVIMEKPRNFWLTGAFEINRFSLNPGRDSVLQQLNERDLVGPAPQMFGIGDLPPLTASGADPQLLRLADGNTRHDRHR